MDRTSQVVSTPDGVRIAVDRYQGEGRTAAVIICPGFFQSKDTATFQRMNLALADEYDVLAMDFRGHGRSTGLYTFSAKESADLEAVLAFARPRYQRIGLLGFSMGGAIAINTVRRFRGAVQSLVAVSAPCAFEEIEFKWWTVEAMRTGTKGLEVGAGCRPGNPLIPKERPIENIQKLKSLPILFIHGTRDAIVGVEHSRRLYAAASQPKRLEIVEGGGHAEALFRDDPERFTRLIREWFTPALSSRPPSDITT